MSVFEPYPMRDTVQHFCEKHLEKIKSYMESLMVKLPLPVKCTGKNYALLFWIIPLTTYLGALFKRDAVK